MEILSYFGDINMLTTDRHDCFSILSFYAHSAKNAIKSLCSYFGECES